MFSDNHGVRAGSCGDDPLVCDGGDSPHYDGDAHAPSDDGDAAGCDGDVHARTDDDGHDGHAPEISKLFM